MPYWTTGANRVQRRPHFLTISTGPATREFSRYQRCFRRWTFANNDVEKAEVSPSDFLYTGPLYDVPFTQYARGGFNWNAQVRTAEWPARHPGSVVHSNQATDRIVDLYKRLWLELTFLRARRMISCTSKRRHVRELLATKNLEPGS